MTDRTTGATHVVVTECDHDAFAEEQTAAAAAGATFRVAQCRTADAILVQYARITAETMDALPRLRAIGRYGVGVDSVDVDAATARGIAVCNVPDYGTEAVSDHAIALALSVARAIPRLDRGLRAGRFELPAVRPVYQVRGRVFGVLGLGLIGTETARKAAGLGYEVIGHDVRATPGSTYHGVRAVTLDELLERSQVLSLHVPLDDATHHLVDAAALALMRRDAILVNTSRGGVVDTAALVAALREGRILGAGIDVHEAEPVPVDHPLTGMDQVVLTPHLAWYTEESYGELKRRTMQNVLDVCAGLRPANVVNPSALAVAS